MTCSYCFTPLAPDARFCCHCGRPAPEAVFDPEGEAEPVVAVPRSGFLGMLVVLGIGAALVATGLNPWIGLPLIGFALVIWLTVWFVPFAPLNVTQKEKDHDHPSTGPATGAAAAGAESSPR